MAKIKYRAIIEGVMAVAIIALLAGYGPGLTDNTHYCADEGKLMEAEFGISGGQHTRLYLNEAHDSWDYCSTGWVKASDYVKVDNSTNKTEPPLENIELKILANGEEYVCKIPGVVDSPYLTCESGTGKQAYIGELITPKEFRG